MPIDIITDAPALAISDVPCEVCVERFGVRLFELEAFLGRSQFLGIGRHTMSSLAIGNDATRSIRVPIGLLVTAYEDADFEGQSFTLETDAAEIDIGISSLVITPQRRLRRA